TARWYETELARQHVRAFVAAPCVADSEWVATLVVVSRQPRRFATDELLLVRMVADRAWLALDHARLLRKLQRSDERFRFAARATSEVMWDWDLTTDQVVWNDAIRTTLRHEVVRPGASFWIDHIHPDDRAHVLSGIRASIAGLGTGEIWIDEYRF